MARALINMGADVNFNNDLAFSPIHLAALKDHAHCAEMIRVLLDARADPLAKSHVKRSTAMHLAAANGNVSAMQAFAATVLLRHAAWPSSP